MKTQHKVPIVALLFVVLTFLFCEEIHYGYFSNKYADFYTSYVFLPLEAVRNKDGLSKRLNISIVVVVNETEHLSNYKLAQWTLSCYAKIHEYPLIVIDFSKNATLQAICPHSDFMFRRHCAVSHLLRDDRSIDYILFVDADIGVINPNHLIEEYLTDAELIFYERIFNHEIMAGTYIAKRTNFTIQFLGQWADSFYSLPSSFHGSDNGAIHNIFLDFSCGDCSPRWRKICDALWRKSENYDDLSVFTNCARLVMGERNRFCDGKLHLAMNTFQSGDLKRGNWCRDGWLTNNEWSPRDFLVHGWQAKRFNRAYIMFAGWVSPLAMDFLEGILDTCAPNRRDLASRNWPYKNTFIKSDEYIDEKLRIIVAKTDVKYFKDMLKISRANLRI